MFGGSVRRVAFAGFESVRGCSLSARALSLLGGVAVLVSLSVPVGSFVRQGFPSEGSDSLVWLVPAVRGFPVAGFQGELLALGCQFVRSCSFTWSGQRWVAAHWVAPPAVLAQVARCPVAPGGGSQRLGVGLVW